MSALAEFLKRMKPMADEAGMVAKDLGGRVADAAVHHPKTASALGGAAAGYGAAQMGEDDDEKMKRLLAEIMGQGGY